MAMALVAVPFVAAAIHALGFWTYNTQTKEGVSKPNSVSWAIWVFLAVLIALTFRSITSLFTAAVPFVGAVGCTLTFVNALVTGKFEWPDWKEWVIFAACLVAIVIWKFYSSPLNANLVVVGAFILSCWPLWAGVWADPTKEKKALPWLLWGGAYGLTTFATFMSKGFSLELTTPVIITLSHLAVPVICAIRKK